MNSSFRPKRKNCKSADCTHRKYFFKREATVPCETPAQQPLARSSANETVHRQKKSDTVSKTDMSKQYMKLLISSNSEYFQNKIKVTDKLRPNNYRFKIPMNTGKTMYRNEYMKKDKNYSVDNLMVNSNCFPQNQTHSKFQAKTNYQNQFVSSPQIKKSGKKKENNKSWVADDAPRFMETHNKGVFLNWAGKNCITSMKPSPKPATSNLPFQATSVYNNDFRSKADGKPQQRTQTIVPENAISSKFPTTLMIKESKYRSEFDNKENKGRQVSCKPKYAPAKTTKGFKGATEYNSQYHKGPVGNQSSLEGFYFKERTVQELQTLIMDL